MATYTAPTTRASGYLVTAANWNTDIVENIKYFKDAPTFDGAVTASSTLTAANNVGLAATKKLYLDGVALTGDTYISESSANVLSLFSGNVEAKLTSGVLTVSGFGTHSFSATGTGAQILQVKHQAAGATNQAVFLASTSTFDSEFGATSSSFTPGSGLVASGTHIYAAGSGGFSLVAAHASGAIRFYTGGTIERMSVSSSGLLTVGDLVTGTTGRIRLGNTSVANYAVLSIEGTYSVSGSGGGALYISPTVNVDAGESAGTALIRTSGGFVEAASGTNPLLAGISIGVPSVTTTGSQTTTNTASLYVAGAMTAGTTANYALWVAAGGVRLGAFGAGTATFDASGNLSSVSDERMKDRISDLGYGLAEILALRPVRYGYNALSGLERDHLYGGFIAQDVQRVMPLAVNTNADGYLSLSDRPITGALVTAIQQHDATIQSLAARIAALESK